MSHIILVIYFIYEYALIIPCLAFKMANGREPFKLNLVWEDEQPEERTFWERTKQDCPVMKHVL